MAAALLHLALRCNAPLQHCNARNSAFDATLQPAQTSLQCVYPSKRRGHTLLHGGTQHNKPAPAHINAVMPHGNRTVVLPAFNHEHTSNLHSVAGKQRHRAAQKRFPVILQRPLVRKQSNEAYSSPLFRNSNVPMPAIGEVIANSSEPKLNIRTTEQLTKRGKQAAASTEQRTEN